MDQFNAATPHREPWNKGKLVGQRTPFKLKEIWAIRIRLQIAHRVRDLALFDLAIDSKLRACDLVKMRVRDLCHGDRVATRVIVMQKETQRPVQFEITEQTREAITNWIGRTCPPASTLASSTGGYSRSGLIWRPTARTRCGAPRCL